MVDVDIEVVVVVSVVIESSSKLWHLTLKTYAKTQSFVSELSSLKLLISNEKLAKQVLRSNNTSN